jgi:hypothetical protein
MNVFDVNRFSIPRDNKHNLDGSSVLEDITLLGNMSAYPGYHTTLESSGAR